MQSVTKLAGPLLRAWNGCWSLQPAMTCHLFPDVDFQIQPDHLSPTYNIVMIIINQLINSSGSPIMPSSALLHCHVLYDISSYRLINLCLNGFSKLIVSIQASLDLLIKFSFLVPRSMQQKINKKSNFFFLVLGVVGAWPTPITSIPSLLILYI